MAVHAKQRENLLVPRENLLVLCCFIRLCYVKPILCWFQQMCLGFVLVLTHSLVVLVWIAEEAGMQFCNAYLSSA
jgi:hypothetical protein